MVPGPATTLLTGESESRKTKKQYCNVHIISLADYLTSLFRFPRVVPTIRESSIRLS
jgi:hypothetical protein